MRYFIAFAYFGKHYHGWQKQPNAVTVQETLEGALSKLLGATTSLMGAGRTDTGVHARQMYAHFDGSKIDDRADLVYRLNAFLPDDISVQEIVEVPANAHARFDATDRTYEYWVARKKDPFMIDAAYFIKNDLDIEKMNTAAELLLVHSDFECFSKSNTDVKTFRCDVKRAEWTQEKDLLVFTITADRFLRNMVRAIVGTLLEVGEGKTGLDDVKTILKSGNRAKAGPSVPAKGLYLTQINYPKTVVK